MGIEHIPKTIDDVVARFCHDVYPDSQPVYVPYKQVESNFGVGYCMDVVKEQVDKLGGEAVTGWTIWYTPPTYIEGEFHICWRSPDNELWDLTPKHFDTDRILFLPQPIEFDYSKPIANKRRALVDNQEIRATVMFYVMREKAIAKRWTKEEGYELTEDIMRSIAMRAKQILDKNVPTYLTCPCGSGLKFKKCCGRPYGTPFEFI